MEIFMFARREKHQGFLVMAKYRFKTGSVRLLAHAAPSSRSTRCVTHL